MDIPNAAHPSFPIYPYPFFHPSFMPAPIPVPNASYFQGLPSDPSPSMVKQSEQPIIKRSTVSYKDHKAPKPKKKTMNTGQWNAKEHRLFLEAMQKYGNDWSAVVEYVGTRTAAQARSHAQKYYSRLKKHAIQKIKNNPNTANLIFVITREYRNYTGRTNVVEKNAQKVQQEEAVAPENNLSQSVSPMVYGYRPMYPPVMMPPSAYHPFS